MNADLLDRWGPWNEKHQDPHPQYLSSRTSDAMYAPLSHEHTALPYTQYGYGDAGKAVYWQYDNGSGRPSSCKYTDQYGMVTIRFVCQWADGVGVALIPEDVAGKPYDWKALAEAASWCYSQLPARFKK